MDSYHTNRETTSNTTHNAVFPNQNAAKLHILKSIKTKFYIHKSFELQSDLEFLPAFDESSIGTNRLMNGLASPGLNSNGFSPNLPQNRLSDYYDHGISKHRMYLNPSSPKRTTSNLNPKARKLVGDNQAMYFQQNVPSSPNFDHQYMHQNIQRNW